jgi:SulP family sulfate permease
VALAGPLSPRLVACLRTYDRRTAAADVAAGITVGLVALPLAMAFAIASGLSPQAGIYCAIVTGFIVSALGGSRVQIAGPTGAFVVVVAGIVAKYGVDGLFMCTMMAGVMLVVMGLTGMGAAVRFIPRPVVVGFTNGIAVLIASTQLRDFFGIDLMVMPGEFWPRMTALASRAGTFTPQAAAVAIVTLAIIVAIGRWLPRVPGAIVALCAGTAAAHFLGLGVETVGSRFGGIPSGLPHVAMPAFRASLIPTLLMPAITVGLLGAIESLMSAMVADKMSGDRHDSNMELVAQGVANLVSPMVGGLPATGAIARTATNIRSGARTPVAGIVHSLTLLVILLVAAPLAGAIPMAVLAAILMVVSYNMGEWREIPELLRLSKADIAVEVGMVLAALLFIRRVAETTTVAAVTDEYIKDSLDHSLHRLKIPPYIRIFRIHGPFLFGATDKLNLVSDNIDSLPEIVVLRLRNMNAIDGTGLLAFEELADRLHQSGRELLLCGARRQPAHLMERADFHRHVGDENICQNIGDAIARAEALHAERLRRSSAERHEASA